MDEISRFVAISRYAGGRYDLVQAGGGNASVKLADGTMLIKGSGYLLSDVNRNNGHVRVSINQLRQVLLRRDLHILPREARDAAVTELVNAAVVDDNKIRPSIETLLHALMAKYTLHTHPLVVNAVCCRSDWRTILLSLFPGALLVDYRTPGIDLALELRRQLDMTRSDTQRIVFLQNHGLIISVFDYSEIEAVTETTLAVLERHCSVNLGRYRATTSLIRLLAHYVDTELVVYLSEDAEIQRLLARQPQLLTAPPFCPDMMVYCGAACCRLRTAHDAEAVQSHLNKHQDLPRVIFLDGLLYFVAPTLGKAREMEEVCKFHLQTLSLAGPKATGLSASEQTYLGGWEAELYRQNL